MRIFTKASVKLVFDEPVANSHNEEGVAAGDIIVKAEDNAGMKVTIIS